MKMKKTWSQMLLILSICAVCGSSFAQPAQRVLTKMEELYPQGWSVGDQVKFKKGSTVTTNDSGAVISGTLAGDTYLRPQGWQRIINDYYFVSAYTNKNVFFPRYYRYWNNGTYNMALSSHGHIRYKGGNLVTFSEQGTVLSGTIDNETMVLLNENEYGFVAFKSGTVLAFYDNGSPKTGTLNEDTKLRPVGWQKNAVDNENAGFVEFKAKSQIEFTDTGEVMQCKVKAALKWRNTGGEIELPAGTIVKFTEQGAKAITETK